jgi:protein gp37
MGSRRTLWPTNLDAAGNSLRTTNDYGSSHSVLVSGMADSSTIEWTDATWNPVTGCTKISAGCDHCYAERFSERFRGVPGHPFETGFDLTLRPARLQQPLLWRQPRMIFVNSMSDLFHKEIPAPFIEAVFDTMEKADWHTFQVLTKRSSLMRNFLRRRYGDGRGPAHMWFGVSVEDGTKLSRVRHLQQAPAGVRFLSIEPLIAPLGTLDLIGIDWIIVGGESGPGARPMDPQWVRDIRDQCARAGVAFFFKQWGGLRPKFGGRTLDGREWSEFPAVPRRALQDRRRMSKKPKDNSDGAWAKDKLESLR